MSAVVARVISMEDHRQSAPQLENGFLRVALEIEDALLLKIDTKVTELLSAPADPEAHNG